MSAVALLWKIPLTVVRLIGSFIAPDFFLPQVKFAGKRVLITGGGVAFSSDLLLPLKTLTCVPRNCCL